MTTHQQQAEALFEEWREKQEWWQKPEWHILDKIDMKDFAAFCLERREQQISELRDLLEQLADIQNGPPLIRHEKEWRELMDKIYTKLKETE